MKSRSKATGIEAMLEVAIQDQRQAIVKCIERLALDAKAMSTPDKKMGAPVQFKLKSAGLSAEQQKQFSKIIGNIRDAPLMAQLTALLSGSSYAAKASRAVKQGKFDTAITELLKTSRAVGAANAFASYDQFGTVNAHVKARILHDRNKDTKEKVLAYWRAKIDPKMSAPNAALKIYGLSVATWPKPKKKGDDEPKAVSIGKIEEWIREAKRSKTTS